ncbi:hypothetical protein ACODT3_19305 [Streptomyces sp. 4.24]|uniref:hypothetical protein n=1 Tax=Streptomyces TaxID=1883 RepID=UPI003816FA68
MSNDTALALAAAVASIPAFVWWLRLTAPDRRARARARAVDRALFRLARAACANPAQCPIHIHRAEGTGQ